MSVSKNSLDQAIVAARDALDDHDYGHEIPAYVVRNLLAALDTARGEAVVHLGRYFCDGPEGHFWCDSLTHARKFVDAVDADHEWTITTVAPPAADAALADTQRAIIEAAERRGYERGLEEEAAAAVPDGYALVPVEPTQGMLAAAADEVAKHSTQDCYEHFLAYSGLEDSPWIKYAYFHGADVGLDRPSTPAPPAAAVPEILCTTCGHPTMHMGSMCYGCTQAAMLAAKRKGE